MSKMKRASFWVDQLALLPHPEGGFYRETYRSVQTHQTENLEFPHKRSWSTSIYYLLEKGDFSAFHKIKSDELWHFYAGESLYVYVIHASGRLEIIKLGNKPEKGEVFQAVVPAECWFASRPSNESTFSLVGCTVAPGFHFEDFEMAKAASMVKDFPQHAKIIQELCRE